MNERMKSARRWVLLRGSFGNLGVEGSNVEARDIINDHVFYKRC